MGMDLQNLPGTGFNGDHRVYSNFFDDNYVIQQVCITQPKNLLIDVLRKYFANDAIYTYRMDEYGFPLTRDLTGIEVDSEETTQILISDIFRYEVKFYPAIIVKNGGGQYKPISFNQNSTFRYRIDREEDAAGFVTETKVPSHRVYAGAWNMNYDITIYSESQAELEELVDIVTMLLQYVAWNELRANGLFINNLSIGGENAEPYANDYVYNQTISLTTYSEWRVEIPLDNIIEKLIFYFDSVRTPIPGVATDADALELKYDDILELADIS
jgi:hypothetical protein